MYRYAAPPSSVHDISELTSTRLKVTKICCALQTLKLTILNPFMSDEMSHHRHHLPGCPSVPPPSARRNTCPNLSLSYLLIKQNYNLITNRNTPQNPDDK